MNKTSNNLKVVCGTLVGIMVGGLTVVGANQAIQAIQNTEIKVSLNGQVQTFKDEITGETQYPITYHDRTYLPLRNVAQLAGLNVGYDEKNNIATLNSLNNMGKVFEIFSDSIATLPAENGQNEKMANEFGEYTLTPKRKLEFNYNNRNYRFVIGIVNDGEYGYIKDLNSNKIYQASGSYDHDFKDRLDNYNISICDFNKTDEDIQLIIDWNYNPADGQSSTLYDINSKGFYDLGIMPYYSFITNDGRFGSYIWWLNEKVISNYYEVQDGKLIRYVCSPDQKDIFTVNEQSINIIKNSKGEYLSSAGMLTPGEKIHIVSVIDDGFWSDYMVQRENGEVVIVGQVAGRT